MLSLRDAVIEDLPEILGIYNDIILNTTAVWSWEPHTLEMRKEWFEQRKNDGFPIIVAEAEGHIVGFASIGHFRTWKGYQFTVENSLYVTAHCRGMGVGKALLQATIEAAKVLKLHCIVAGIDGDNEVSIALHKKYGFEEVAHLKEVGFKFDRWLDLKFLQLIIPY